MMRGVSLNDFALKGYPVSYAFYMQFGFIMRIKDVRKLVVSLYIYKGLHDKNSCDIMSQL